MRHEKEVIISLYCGAYKTIIYKNMVTCMIIRRVLIKSSERTQQAKAMKRTIVCKRYGKSRTYQSDRFKKIEEK